MITRIDITTDYYCDICEGIGDLNLVFTVTTDDEGEKSPDISLVYNMCLGCSQSVFIPADALTKLLNVARALDEMIGEAYITCPDDEDDDPEHGEEPVASIEMPEHDYYVIEDVPPTTPQSPDPFNF